MAVEVVPAPQAPRWSRSYPPLVLLAVAVLVAALVLPSSLNLPQSNPSTVLEYAPVPPEDDNPPPPDDGSMASLGLGSSSSLQAGGEPPPPPPPPPPDEGVGTRPQQKRCIGDKQTEDPMAPPCVPYFDGENFGATYQGVSEEEIKVLIYYDNGFTNQEGPHSSDVNEIIDLDRERRPNCPKSYPARPQSQCDYLPIRLARAYRDFFNERFQTYNRRVKYYMYISSASSAPARRRDAQELWEELEPFAVIDQATFSGHNEAFVDAMSARGVLAFTQQAALRNQFFVKNAPYSWGFWPDAERWAPSYVSYICTKVAPYRVRRFDGGQGAPNGEERRFGLYYTTDQGEPGLRHFAELVKDGLRRCGVEAVAEGHFPRARFVVDGGDRGTEQAQAVDRFISNDVTTVLWLGGVEGRFTQFANTREYYPEIIFAGDLELDNNVTARNQNANVWRNAWGTSFQLRLDRPEAQPGYLAYREGDPNGQRDEARYANDVYRDHFMLFQAIQVAGPRLNPGSVEQGFHAIPEFPSESPYVAAFFFQPNDYTSVKDSTEVWWDPDGIPPGGADTGSASGITGCYRMVNEGYRYLPGRWPDEDRVFLDGNDPCTAFEGARRLRPA